MKKFKILPLALILLLAVSLLPVSALAVTEPSVAAQAAILVDADSGEVYFEKNADSSIQPASTTKMMTALLAVEAVERGEIALSDMVTASGDVSYNLQEDSTDAAPRIQYGETLSVEDLLYLAMLASANEACNMLAEYISGSVSAFVDAMNARAEELGCTGTHFVNCNGLEEEGHYSTARDFSLIACEAVNHKLFTTVSGTLYRTVAATNVSESRALTNTNALLDPESEYYYEPAYGIKTGFFENAGYCLVSAAEKNGMNVVCVLMGGRDVGDQFSDTVTLYSWLFDNYESREILSSTENILTAPVEMGNMETVGVRAENGVSVILPKDFDLSRIGYEYTMYYEQRGEETLHAPVNAGEVLGELTVVELDENQQTVQTFGTSRLVAASTVEMSRKEYLETQFMELLEEPMIHKILLILGIIFVVYLLLVFIYTIQRLRHVHSLRKAKRARAKHQTAEDALWLSIPEEPEEDPDIEYFQRREEARRLEEASREPEPEEEPEPAPRPVLREVPRVKPTETAKEAPRKAPAPAPVEKPRRKNPEELHKEVFDDDFFDSFFQH